MPVVVAEEDFERWLIGDPVEAGTLLRPAPSDLLEAIPISNRVNTAANDDAGLLDPIEPTLF